MMPFADRPSSPSNDDYSSGGSSLSLVSSAASNRKDLSDWSREWRRLRMQKHRMRGGVEARVITNLGMWYGEHYLTQARDTILTRPLGKDADKNKLWLVFNMIRKQTKRKIGRLWSVAPEFRATPNHVDPRAFAQADVVNSLIQSLDIKLKERWQHWHRLWWLTIAGTVVEHVPWVMDATNEPLPRFDPQSGELVWRDQQTGAELLQSQVESIVSMGTIPPERFAVVEDLQMVGDVGCEIISPLNFFIDHATTDITKLPPGGACTIAQIKTLDFIEENFGSDLAKKAVGQHNLQIVQTRLLDAGPAVANISLRDLMPAIQGTRLPDDPPMAIVCTRYQAPSNKFPHGRRSIFVPETVTLDDDEIAYGEIPCIDLHYEPATTSFWTGDFVTDLVPGQKFLNKRMSQLGESANAGIYEVLLLGSEIAAQDIPSDLPGVVNNGLDENGQPRVQVMQRGQLPVFFLESINMISQYIESVGSADLLSHRQFPGQLRGPLAIPMLQEILDSEDGPFFAHMGEQLSRIKQHRLNRVKQFYPPIRTLNYVGKNQKHEVLVFHTDAILRAGTDFNITVDLGSLLPEIGALRHARVREDMESPLAIVYTNPRTGRIDPTKIALALKYTDQVALDRETEWRKLAQFIIDQLWKGEPIDPDFPYAFCDHNAMMDEYESAMAMTEFYKASESVKQAFFGIYEKHKQFLDAIQAAQAQAIQGQQAQSAIAMATQQVAAKVAAETVDASIQQIREQGQMARTNPPINTIEAEMRNNASAQGRIAGGQPGPNVGPGMQQAMNMRQLMGR